ncbi:hypothetical protein LXA47_30010 [Massilia sp. P8910]|uniref:hypothetical protein n=1 Tax=Massilia antarctica TaxID=2765360 RepID=UPI0011AF7F32|nr:MULTISPECIES: hypothetical protein [Massilia]MCE3607804.1 hypothetical protein [Massilia antarctica]MCY0910620.1 hypothetical protein [Massilia sp. H27-R4]
MPTGPRPFLSLISLSLVVTALLSPSIARACKDRQYPATFPVAELRGYAHAYVVRVNRLTSAAAVGQSQYSPPFSFEGMVMRTIKGPRLAGDVIRGATTSGEEASARCPISLEEGKTYLLMLNGSGSTYALPRYGSLYVSADRPEFEGYLADLTKESH